MANLRYDMARPLNDVIQFLLQERPDQTSELKALQHRYDNYKIKILYNRENHESYGFSNIGNVNKMQLMRDGSFVYHLLEQEYNKQNKPYFSCKCSTMLICSAVTLMAGVVGFSITNINFSPQ